MTTKRLIVVVVVLAGLAWSGGVGWRLLQAARARSLPTASIERDEGDADDSDDHEGKEAGALSAVFSAGNEAFAVGEGGTILHSSDGGRVWSHEPTAVDDDLHAVWGTVGRAGARVWAVGDQGRILHQRAPGVWAPQASGTEEDLHAIWGSSAEDLWVAGDEGVLLRSRDGGAHWQAVVSGTDEDLRAISGAPGGVFVCGEHGALKKVSAPN
jgi:photosystem II stability/assembly factor-like uncharacterized protein